MEGVMSKTENAEWDPDLMIRFLAYKLAEYKAAYLRKEWEILEARRPHDNRHYHTWRNRCEAAYRAIETAEWEMFASERVFKRHYYSRIRGAEE